jgi:hypothetical protein
MLTNAVGSRTLSPNGSIVTSKVNQGSILTFGGSFPPRLSRDDAKSASAVEAATEDFSAAVWCCVTHPARGRDRLLWEKRMQYWDWLCGFLPRPRARSSGFPMSPCSHSPLIDKRRVTDCTSKHDSMTRT